MISTIQHNLKAAARFGFLKNIIAGLLLLAVQQLQAQTATLPMQKGMAVVSCFSGIGNNNNAFQDPNGPVLAIFDLRNPQGNGAPSNPPAQWAAASAGAFHPANWTPTNMGELFGVSIEEGATSPAIFASTTGITRAAAMQLLPKTGGTGGEVFRINSTTGAITTLATLPNTTYTFSGFSRYVGLGDNTYNRINNVLYVSNMDNGLVYAVNATTGALLGTPFEHNTTTADNPAQPFTQLERIVFGLGYNEQENKLYYAVKAGNALTNNNQVYTVGLNADGSINAASKSASAVVSFSPLPNPNPSGPGRGMISDIAFSADGTQMLLAEMTVDYVSNILTKDAHAARVFKYVKSAGTWSQNLSYAGQIGSLIDGNNAAGGVDFGFNNYGTNSAGTNLDDAAVMTADAIYFNPGGTNLYGIQISNIVAPNTFASAYAVDLDGNISAPNENNDKYTSGDIEVYGGCQVIDNPSTAQTLCTGNAGSAITATTDQNTASSIRFVRFSTDQTAINAAPTAGELAAIYAGGTVLSTVTPTGAASPYTATLTTAAANWAAAAPGTYYVYAILNPDQGAACRPVQEIIVTITAPPTFTLTQTAPGCSPGAIPNNNGKITLTAFSNANRYGVSTGATYTGPVYASATALPAVPPSLDVQINIPNTGGTYTIRLFNQSNTCFTDQTVVVAPVVCSCPATTYPLCAGESYTLSTAPGLTNIQWQINTGAGPVNIPGANGITYIATVVGTYTYTADDPAQGCTVAGCCPVTLVSSACCPLINNPSAAQVLCTGDAGSAITATTDQNTANSIRFLRFSTDQTAINAAPTAAELAAIYAGGTVLATVTPAGAAAPYTATLSAAAANWSALAPGTYYIYVILNPDLGAACRPVQEIIVTVVPQANAGADGSTSVCDNSAATIDLFSLITGEQAGGTWVRLTGTGGTFNGSGTFTPAVGSTTSTFQYTVTGTTPCPNDQSVATVNITSQPNLTVTNGSICANSSIDLTNLVTSSGGGAVSFYNTLADAQAGTNPLASSNVSPVGTKIYYVRSAASATCYATAAITVTIASSPGLVVTTASVCKGSSIDLNTLVTNAGGGTLTFHSTYANAIAGTPIVAPTVSPTVATNYYVRSTFGSGCFGVREITVTLKVLACGVITTSGPN